MVDEVGVQFRLAEDQTQRLTEWKQEPTIYDLKRDLEAAKPAQSTQVAKIDHWNAVLKAKPIARKKGRSTVQPKVVRRQAEWRYSALTEPFTGSEHLFKVKPVTFEDVKAANQNELVLNHQFRTKFNRIKFIDDFVRTTVDEGTSITQVGWKRHVITVMTEVPVYNHIALTSDEQFEALKQALELSTSDPHTYKTTVPPEMQAAVDYYNESGQANVAVDTGQKQKVPTKKILANHPTAKVLNPANVFIDPSCEGDIEKALFVIVSFETNKAELIKEGKRYKNLDRVNFEGNTPLSTPDHATNTPQEFQMTGVNRKKVVAYEYWGFYDVEGDGKLVPIVCTWIGDTIIRMEVNPFPDEKLPFVITNYNPVKRELFGEPDAELLEDNQKIIGALMRGMIDLMGRSANSQQGMAKGLLDPLNRRKFENGDDYEFNPNMTPANGIIQHKFPELPQSALVMVQAQNNEAEALTGVKSFSGGVSGEAYGQVAAGIRGALDAASKREMAILRRLAKGIVEIGRKIISMNQAFLSDQEVVRITNETFVTVDRDDLQGDFDLETDISTAEVDNAQAQDLAFMLQTMGPNMDPKITFMVMAHIARLKRMPDLAKQLENYQPQPDPIQQQMQQLEIKKLEAEIAEIQSRQALNESKVGETAAKTDKMHTDTAEQAAGVTHDREMERIQGQAEGNQNLEVTKALLAEREHANGMKSKPDIEAAVGFNALTSQKNKAPVLPAPTGLSGGEPQMTPGAIDSAMDRDNMANQGDPRFSLGSKYYEPELDPASNPSVGL